MALIIFENVSKTYMNERGIKSVSFEITSGEFVFLTGESGAGKTSILRLLLGAFPPDHGKIFMDGIEVDKLTKEKLPEYRRQIGVVFQDYRLLPNKTVEENVFLPLRISNMGWAQSEKIVCDALKMVGMAGRGSSFPHELSGGEQQRVAIARAIVNHPSVILADEPTGNLDRASADEVHGLMRQLNAEGKTVIFATHDRSFINKGDREISLKGGMICGNNH